MNKKVVIGIVIGVIVLLILILGYGEVTGKFSIFGRRYKEGQYAFYALRFEKPSVPGTLEEGTLGEDINWASVSYSYTSKLVITITSYRDITSERVLAGREGYSPVTIHGITYQNMESNVDEADDGDFVFVQYYTTIDEHTYYISATMKDIPENRTTFNTFMNSISVGESEEPTDPNAGSEPTNGG